MSSIIYEIPDWVTDGGQTDAQYGYSVGTAGDVNGDGYSDLIIGAPHYDGDYDAEGKAYIFYGSPAGLAETADWSAQGGQETALLGRSVGAAGDVNGDGYDDVTVEAPWYDHPEIDEGASLVFYGSASGLDDDNFDLLESNIVRGPDEYGPRYGESVGTVGDVNADGYDDVFVGTYRCSIDTSNEGRVYVYYGPESGLSSRPDWTAEGSQSYAWLGHGAAAGEVNGDGYDDVIIAANHYNSGEENEGKAFLYYGSADGLSATPVWTAESDKVNARLGRVVDVGDVNGDGFDDVIIGAGFYTVDLGSEGMAYAYYGSQDGPSPTPDWMKTLDQSYTLFGWSVGTASDTDGDGYDDAVIGAHWATNGESKEGQVHLYRGSSSGLDDLASFAAEGNQADAQFGFWTDTAGDVNGDGCDDIAVGARWYDGGETDEGRAYVYLGANEQVEGLQAAGDGPTLLGQATTFSATVTAGENVTYRWSYGDGITGTGSLVTHTYTTPGDYGAVVTATNCGSLLVATVGVSVDQAIEGLSITAHRDSSEDRLVDFTATVVSGSRVSYSWDFGDGSVGTGQTVSHAYSQSGTYTVVVTAVNSVSSDAATDTVDIAPADAVADFSASPRTGIAPLLVSFSNLSSGDYSTCQWTLGDGASSTTCSDISHTYQNPGNYTLTLTVSGSGGADTVTRTNYITVTAAPPVASFVAQPIQGEIPLTVQFTDTSTGPITSWHWAFGDAAVAQCNIRRILTRAPAYILCVSMSQEREGQTLRQEWPMLLCGSLPTAYAYP